MSHTHTVTPHTARACVCWSGRDTEYREYSFHVQRIQFVSVLQYCTHVFDLYMVNSCRRSTCLVHYKFIERINFSKFHYFFYLNNLFVLCVPQTHTTTTSTTNCAHIKANDWIVLTIFCTQKAFCLPGSWWQEDTNYEYTSFRWRWSNRWRGKNHPKLWWNGSAEDYTRSDEKNPKAIASWIFCIQHSLKKIRNQNRNHVSSEATKHYRRLLHRDSLQSSDKIVLHVACLIFITKSRAHTHKVAAPLMPNIWSRLT